VSPKPPSLTGGTVCTTSSITGRSYKGDFYFLCPECNRILEIMGYCQRFHRPESERPFGRKGKLPQAYFGLSFSLYCRECQLEGSVRIDNAAGGQILPPWGKKRWKKPRLPQQTGKSPTK
jgi:hypothetical protein